MAAKRIHVRVKYQGTWHVLYKLAAEKGREYKPVYEKWLRRGRPVEVEDDLFIQGDYTNKKKLVTFEGQQYTLDELAEVVGCSRGLVGKRARQHGDVLTLEQLKIDRGTQAIALENHKKRKARLEADKEFCPNRPIDPNDRSPGWWERLHLVDAGKNGFCSKGSMVHAKLYTPNGQV